MLVVVSCDWSVFIHVFLCFFSLVLYASITESSLRSHNSFITFEWFHWNESFFRVTYGVNLSCGQLCNSLYRVQSTCLSTRDRWDEEFSVPSCSARKPRRPVLSRIPHEFFSRPVPSRVPQKYFLHFRLVWVFYHWKLFLQTSELIIHMTSVNWLPYQHFVSQMVSFFGKTEYSPIRGCPGRELRPS